MVMDTLFPLLGPKTTVIHCSSVNLLPGEPASIFSDNTKMTLNVLSALEENDIRNYIYLSSTDVYGRPPRELPLTEKSLPHPTGYYGLSKYSCEKLLSYALEEKQTPLSILRLPGIYGIEDKGKSIIGQFLSKIINGEELLIHSPQTLELKRDYFHIDDVLSICNMLYKNPLPGIFNLVTGQSNSLQQLIQHMEKVLEKKAVYKILNAPPVKQFDLQFDSSLLKETFHFHPLSSIQGIELYAEKLRAPRATAGLQL